MEKGNILLRVSLMDLVYVMAEISCQCEQKRPGMVIPSWHSLAALA
jgi:hypothetical protein